MLIHQSRKRDLNNCWTHCCEISVSVMLEKSTRWRDYCVNVLQLEYNFTVWTLKELSFGTSLRSNSEALIVLYLLAGKL